MNPSGPVQDQSMPGRISLTINHDLMEHGAQDALLQLHRDVRMIPHYPHIITQRDQLRPLLITERGTSFSQSGNSRFQISHLLQRVIPSRLQLGSYKTIFRLRGIELPACSVGFKASSLQSQLQCFSLLVVLGVDAFAHFDRGLDTGWLKTPQNTAPDRSTDT